MLKNLLDACFGAVCFYIIGYGFAFGDEDTGNGFIGYGPFGLRGEDRSQFYLWFFQFAVRSITAQSVQTALHVANMIAILGQPYVSVHSMLMSCPVPNSLHHLLLMRKFI